MDEWDQNRKKRCGLKVGTLIVTNVICRLKGAFQRLDRYFRFNNINIYISCVNTTTTTTTNNNNCFYLCIYQLVAYISIYSSEFIKRSIIEYICFFTIAQ